MYALKNLEVKSVSLNPIFMSQVTLPSQRPGTRRCLALTSTITVGFRPPSFNQEVADQWENSWLVCMEQLVS